MTTTILLSAGSRPHSPTTTQSSGRWGRCLLLAAAAAGCLLGVTAGTAAAAGAPGATQLAVLLTAQRAYQSPSTGSRQVALVAARRPITGERTTLPVIRRGTGAGGANWLKVLLPGRPNGSSGWIPAQATRELVSAWRLVVNLARRRVTVYRDGHMVRAFRAVVGKSSTPTPTGRFFVEEVLKMPASEAGGPFALALSARSNALQEFEGGPGQIAVHGRNNLGGTLGTAASHGCIRLSTASIDWLAFRIGPGTPVAIKGS